MKAKQIAKVLIALDYDSSAQEVAEKGFSLAKTMNAEVVLLHVIADDSYASPVEYSPIVGFLGFNDQDVMQYTSKGGIKEASNIFLNRIKSHLGDDKIETIVDEGRFSDVILSTAKKIKADVIVMGSHGKGWVEELLIGSVTEKVLKHTKIPLYIVPIRK